MLLDRRGFVPDPATGSPAASWEDGATWSSPPRPIWEIAGETLVVVLGVLVEPGELRSLLRQTLAEETEGLREDVVLQRARQRCSAPGALASALAHRLDSEAAGLGLGPGGCPLARLAGRWQLARDEGAGRRLAALLWTLARDRRWEVRGLEQRASADLLVRALRLLGSRPSGPGASA